MCAQDQASQNPNTDAGGAHEALSLTEELLAIDGYWEKGRFLQGGHPGCSRCSSYRQHRVDLGGSRNRSWEVERKEQWQKQEGTGGEGMG